MASWMQREEQKRSEISRFLEAAQHGAGALDPCESGRGLLPARLAAAFGL